MTGPVLLQEVKQLTTMKNFIRTYLSYLCYTVIRTSRFPNSTAYNILSVTTEEGKLHHNKRTRSVLHDQSFESTPKLKRRNSPYLTYPANNHRPCGGAFLQRLGVQLHIIPFQSELIIPEEVPQHFRSSIFVDSSTAILWRSSLWKAGQCNKLVE